MNKRLYTALIGKNEEGSAWGAAVPQIPGCFACGDSFEEAEEHIKENAKDMLEYYLEDDGEFPEWKPLEEFQDSIDTIEDGYPSWARVVIELDLDDLARELESKIKDESAIIITRLFRAIRNNAAHADGHQ